MNAVEPPHGLAEGGNSNGRSASTRRPAGFGVVPKLVIVDATHHGTLIGSKDGCTARAFQAHFRLGRVHSQRGRDGL